MILKYFPAFCGGRLLYGLSISGYSKEQIRDMIIKDQDRIWKDQSLHPNCYSMPPELEEFKSALKWITGITSHQKNFGPDLTMTGIGMIVAVTNKAQTHANKFLPEVGFKPMMETSKYSETSVSARCTTWLSNFHKDTYPILAKATDWVVEEKARKFG